jgi:hypothetical protein
MQSGAARMRYLPPRGLGLCVCAATSLVCLTQKMVTNDEPENAKWRCTHALPATTWAVFVAAFSPRHCYLQTFES